VDGKRYLLVTADDYGIGPATSQGILELAVAGRVTCAVLLVNSPYAEDAVRAWHQAGRPMELGWHPCLTLDRPVSPPGQVPSLVTGGGCFWPLRELIRRIALGRLSTAEVTRELQAQYDRFCDLLGHAPTVVNSHHHVQVFRPVHTALTAVMAGQSPLPYVRRIRESWRTLLGVPGARGKRLFLSSVGRRGARLLDRAGYPGNDVLIGVTDPHCLAAPDALVRWLRRVPGKVVELTCHPGHLDLTLMNRDAHAGDGQLQRRVREFALLQESAFPGACEEADFILAAPADLVRRSAPGDRNAA
jgi:predicted glycoside hydrolase/deacetylase ChbG (UPF0249 family)